MKKMLAGVVIAAIIGVVAYISLRNNESEPKFRTEKVTRGDIV